MSLFAHNDGSTPDVAALMKQNKIDTMIGLPSWQGGLEPDTQTCLDHLCAYNIRVGNLVTVKKASGSMIATNRNNVIRAAIKADAEYVLFIDTDMVFPADAIQRMKRHKKQVVSAMAHSKAPPHIPNMYRRVSRAGWVPVADFIPDSLVKVDCIGGAFILAKTEIFRDIDPPWFASPSIAEHCFWPIAERLMSGEWDAKEIQRDVDSIVKELRGKDGRFPEMPVLGEDYYFSERMRRAGVPIYVDTALKIGHIGKYTYGFEDFKAHKDQGALDGIIDKFGFNAGVA